MIASSVERRGIERLADVEQVQTLLRRAGMDPGPIDRIAGPRTIAAIVGFQQRFLTRPDCHVFFRALGKAQGLVWGGDWTGFRDWAHLQGRQNAELRLVKRESGL